MHGVFREHKGQPIFGQRVCCKPGKLCNDRWMIPLHSLSYLGGLPLPKIPKDFFHFQPPGSQLLNLHLLLLERLPTHSNHNYYF